MTDEASGSGPDPDTSVPLLNLDLERTRIEFREIVREIEDRVDIRSRFRRWRADATGADRAFPVAIVAGAVIAGIAAVGIVGAIRSRR